MSGFGLVSVRGHILVPSPAARINARIEREKRENIKY